MKNAIGILLFVAAVLLWVPGAMGQVIVIANPNVKADTISRVELRSVFTGESATLKDGTHVKPILLKDGPTNAAFASTNLGLSPVGVLVCWRNLVFSGQNTMPKTFESEAEAAAYVARTPSAIGYISGAVPHDGVKVLAVK